MYVCTLFKKHVISNPALFISSSLSFCCVITWNIWIDGFDISLFIFLLLASSRPDLLDAALLRPGRLDRLLFCDFPSQRERFDILTVLSRKVSNHTFA